MNPDTTCPLCKGDLTRKLITYTQHFQGELYLIDNVPALVCDQCNEELLEVDVAGRIFDLVRSGKPQGTRSLPFYDLQAVG